MKLLIEFKADASASEPAAQLSLAELIQLTESSSLLAADTKSDSKDESSSEEARLKAEKDDADQVAVLRGLGKAALEKQLQSAFSAKSFDDSSLRHLLMALVATGRTRMVRCDRFVENFTFYIVFYAVARPGATWRLQSPLHRLPLRDLTVWRRLASV
jgi:hypothetical protein